MVYINRNINSLIISISCDDEHGKALCKDIIEGKLILSKKQALVETLFMSGLIPDKYCYCPITITDKRNREDKSVDIACIFPGPSKNQKKKS